MRMMGKSVPGRCKERRRDSARQIQGKCAPRGRVSERGVRRQDRVGRAGLSTDRSRTGHEVQQEAVGQF